MGGARATRPRAADPVATRVLTKGEPIPAPTGRADDFSWPRGSAPPPARAGRAAADAAVASGGYAARRRRRRRAQPGKPRAGQAPRTATDGQARRDQAGAAAAHSLAGCPATAALDPGPVPLKNRAGLPRQRGRSHQELVDRVRALAAFADRPHHQRLAAAHVAGREHLRVRAAIGVSVSALTLPR